MAGTKGNSGGARAGAGRKPKAEKQTLDIAADEVKAYIEKYIVPLKETYVKKAYTSEKVLLHLMDRILPLEKAAPQQTAIQITFKRFDLDSSGNVIEVEATAITEDQPALPVAAMLSDIAEADLSALKEKAATLEPQPDLPETEEKED